jgi:hypothetical protein
MDQDQKEWAPLLYFVHAVAGSVVAMMHKMGMYRLRINYGVKEVLDYLCNHITATLSCMIATQDERNSPRYRSTSQCRAIGETVLRATFASMLMHKDVDSSVLYAINSLTCKLLLY